MCIYSPHKINFNFDDSTTVRLFFLPTPTSHELQLISVTSGFTRLSMKTKNVCRGLISLYVNFHNNWTMWSTNLHVKIYRWGGEGKRANCNCSIIDYFVFNTDCRTQAAYLGQMAFEMVNNTPPWELQAWYSLHKSLSEIWLNKKHQKFIILTFFELSDY